MLIAFIKKAAASLKTILGFPMEQAGQADRSVDAQLQRPVNELLNAIEDCLEPDPTRSPGTEKKRWAEIRRLLEAIAKKPVVHHLKPIDLKRTLIMFIVFLVGGVHSVCSGMTGLMSLIAYLSLSDVAALTILVGFAALSVVTFILYDFEDLAELLGVRIQTVKSALQDVLDQQVLIHHIHQDLRQSLECAEQLGAGALAEQKKMVAVLDSVMTHLKAEEENIKSQAEIRLWHVATIRYLFVGVAAMAWVFSGYFVGKSAAAIFLGFSATATAATLAAPLSYGLAISCALYAGLMYYKGEYQRILRHLDHWAGVPPFFETRFDKSFDSYKQEKTETERYIKYQTELQTPESQNILTLKTQEKPLRARYLFVKVQKRDAWLKAKAEKKPELSENNAYRLYVHHVSQYADTNDWYEAANDHQREIRRFLDGKRANKYPAAPFKAETEISGHQSVQINN